MIRSVSLSGAARVLQHAAAATLLAVLAACTAGGPATTQTHATSPGTTASTYTGPAPSTPDVQAFKVNLWANISTSDKCGGCHHQGGQSPMFARSDDINAAYQAALPLVNVQQPDQSTLVLRVASGHNCWVADTTACSSEMLTWIKAWLGSSAGSSTSVTLTPPTSTNVTGTKQFPANATDSTPSFASTVYPLLGEFCSGCHAPNAASPQTPFFAQGGTPGYSDCTKAPMPCTQADIQAAYVAAQAKIDLNTPENSRFVVRLRDEHHNCWTVNGPADCAGSAAAMLAQIQAYAAGIQVKQVDTNALLSMGLHLHDGTVASGGNRSEANLVAKYEFKTGTGTTAYDTSGVSPSADLMFTGDVSWVGGWGININKGGKAQASTASSSKITSMITASGEYSIEAWIAPANVAQTQAWIVSYSGSDTTRNATLGQSAMQYSAATRSDKTDANGGKKPLLTNATNFPVQAALTHIVLTYDPVNGQMFYINGQPTGDKDPSAGGSLASWDNTFALVLGAETTGKEQWLGVIKFVAIHSRALTAQQVMQNYNAGVGEKYFMLFDVSSLSGVSKAYIQVTASILDSYSYLFTNPTFISLDPAANPANLPIVGIRYGVNGNLQSSGQSWAMVNATVGGSSYTAANGQLLSSVGGIVAQDKGPDNDLMYLSFDAIGTHSYPFVLAPVAVPPPTYATDVLPPSYGVKNYAQINAAMAKITGVPLNTPATNTVYNTLQQALPPTNDLTAFVASSQSAIAQLADAYCNAAVNTALIRSATFPGLDVTQTAGTYFGSATASLTAAQVTNRGTVINPLINATFGSGITDLNITTAITTAKTELNSLMDKLVTANSSGTGRTAQVAQLTCDALLGSAAVSLQ
jgi:Concanavalin A-like lectin/glucanases superfamily